MPSALVVGQVCGRMLFEETYAYNLSSIHHNSNGISHGWEHKGKYG